MITKWLPSESGCLLDGVHGWHNNYRVVELARDKGMELSAEDEFMLDDYRKNAGMDSGDYVESQGGLLDSAIEWMNENLAVEGYQFGWRDGDFFYMPDEWWQE